jgi:hypothetical protein
LGFEQTNDQNKRMGFLHVIGGLRYEGECIGVNENNSKMVDIAATEAYLRERGAK